MVTHPTSLIVDGFSKISQKTHLWQKHVVSKKKIKWINEELLQNNYMIMIQQQKELNKNV